MVCLTFCYISRELAFRYNRNKRMGHISDHQSTMQHQQKPPSVDLSNVNIDNLFRVGELIALV